MAVPSAGRYKLERGEKRNSPRRRNEEILELNRTPAHEEWTLAVVGRAPLLSLCVARPQGCRLSRYGYNAAERLEECC